MKQLLKLLLISVIAFNGTGMNTLIATEIESSSENKIQVDEEIDTQLVEDSITPEVEEIKEVTNDTLLTNRSDNDYYQNDGNLELTIFDYNPDTKWTLGNLKIVNVKMDYENATEVGKQLSITLPVGMKFNSYDVIQNPSGSYEELMVESNRVFFESSVSPIYQSQYGSVNGTLTYNIKPNTTKVDISFVISIDERLWIKPDIIENAIVIEAYENGSIKNALNININGYSNNYTHLYFSTNPPITLEKNSSYRTSPNGLVRNGLNRNDTIVWKKQVLAFSYPIGAQFISFSNSFGGTIEDDPENGMVTLTIYNLPTTGTYIYANIDSTGVPIGTYTTAPISIAYETFTNETGLLSSSTGSVIIEDVIPNTLSLTTKSLNYYDTLGENYYSPNALVSIRNLTQSIKKNQWFKAVFSEGYEVIDFRLPNGFTNESWTSKTVRYKTNLNSQWREVPAHLKYNLAQINKSKLGLNTNEYFSEIEIEFGDTPTGFKSNQDINSSEANINYYNGMIFPGKLQTSYNNANVTYSVYEKTQDIINESTLTKSTITINRSSSYATASLGAIINNIEFSADTTKRVSVSLGDTNSYAYNQLNATINPSLFIKLPDGVRVNKNTVTASILGSLIDSSNVVVSDEYMVTNSLGQKTRVVKIDILTEVGDYFGTNVLNRMNLRVDLDLVADKSTQITDRTSNIFFWYSDTQKLSSVYGGVSPIADTYNLTGKNNASITLLPVQNRAFTVLPKSEVVVDTYITPSGGTRQNPYDVNDPTTAINFTPGTTAEYTVEVLNNTSSAVNEFYAYIPVPKTGNNFGTNFQTQPFNWDMKLRSTPQIKIYNASGEDVTAEEIDNYIIEYSSDATTASNYESANYSSTYSDTTSMIKVRSVSGEIEPGFKAVLMFYYEVDETPTSAVDKIGTINDFRPYYYYDAGNAGFLQGTLVGAALEIGEVAGLVFEDKDLDGIYGPGDELLANRTVALQERTSINPDVFTTIDTTTTNINGEYAFEGLSNGYMRIVVSKGTGEEFTPLPVSNSINRSMVNLQGESSVVESASLQASHVNAGIIKYQSSDLSVSINEDIATMKAPETQDLTTTITPTFFDDIKDADDSKVWTTSNSSIATVDQNGTINVVGKGLVTITVTIKDMYGNTASDSITIEVNNEYTITYNLGDGINGSNPNIYTYGVGISSFEPATKEGYTFLGWYDSNDVQVTEISPTTLGDVTLYAKWEANIYDITYDLDGGINDATNPATYTYGVGVSNIEPATKDGYTFLGWYDSNDVQVTEVSTTTLGDVTLYAKWEANIYDITYDLDGGINDATNPATYTYGVGVSNFGSATKDGYTFLGWYDSNDIQVAEINTTTFGEITLYAKWEANVYKINYELDEGINGATNPTVYTYGVGVSSFELATKEGYTFLGWNDSNDVQVTEISTTTLGDITLYAKWAKLYTVTFDSSGGTSIPTQLVVEGELINEPSIPVLENYEFTGWYLDPMTRTSSWNFLEDTVTSDITLYSHWTQKENSVIPTDPTPGEALPETGENIDEKMIVGFMTILISIFILILWRKTSSNN